MKIDGVKKIILLGMILLIVAGLVVVALKGFSVALFYKQHEEININVGKEINYKDLKGICDEVFNGKKYEIRMIELFSDSINVRVENTITDEEKNNLINKINEKYETKLEASTLTVNKNANIRIRDLIRPYGKPVCASAITIICYLYLRYRKNEPMKFLYYSFVNIALTELCLASIIAIIRVPVSPLIVNILVLIGVIELLVLTNKKEKELKKAWFF